jgi:hypothetical protein
MTLFNSLNSKKRSQELKQLLDNEKLVTLPGCYDALSAKLIEHSGIKAGFMSGFCVSSTRLGNAGYWFNFIYRDARSSKKYFKYYINSFSV